MTLMSTKVKYMATGAALAAGAYALKKGADKAKEAQSSNPVNVAHAKPHDVPQSFPKKGHLTNILQMLADMGIGPLAPKHSQASSTNELNVQHTEDHPSFVEDTAVKLHENTANAMDSGAEQKAGKTYVDASTQTDAKSTMEEEKLTSTSSTSNTSETSGSEKHEHVSNEPSPSTSNLSIDSSPKSEGSSSDANAETKNLSGNERASDRLAQKIKHQMAELINQGMKPKEAYNAIVKEEMQNNGKSQNRVHASMIAASFKAAFPEIKSTSKFVANEFADEYLSSSQKARLNAIRAGFN